MSAERKPPSWSEIELAPAAERGEHWWPVALAIIAVVGLHVVLPARYRVQPVWVIPVVLLALLAVLIAGDPGRIDRQKTWLRVLMGVVIAVITLANLLAAGRLVVDILTNNKLYATNPAGELAAGGVIWATNVIAFGLWYWDLDRGGAAARAHHPDRNPAFCLPGDAAHGVRDPRLGAAVPGLSVPVVLDLYRLQSCRDVSDQAVGQGPHDDRSGRVARLGRARDLPRSTSSSLGLFAWARPGRDRSHEKAP